MARAGLAPPPAAAAVPSVFRDVDPESGGRLRRPFKAAANPLWGPHESLPVTCWTGRLVHVMRVPCPKCDAVYEIPDALLLAGPRRLRCARCTTEWHAGAPVAAVGPAAAIAVEPPSPPGSDPAAKPASRPPRRAAKPASAKPARSRPGLALGLAWTGTALFVVGLGAGFVVWPAAVTETFPPAARLYDALGIDVTESALSTSPAK